jgi:hypothetical protein
MGQLVEFPLVEGGSILVEVREPVRLSGQPVVRGRGAEEVTDRARQTFEHAVQRVEPAAQAIVTRLSSMAQTPDEIHVEFGLDLHAEAGAFIAAASATANFTVALTWHGGTSRQDGVVDLQEQGQRDQRPALG